MAGISCINVDIDTERMYTTDEVRSYTKYGMTQLRDLEKEGKIPKAQRDDNGWRTWKGSDVLKIVAYRKKTAGNRSKRLALARKIKKEGEKKNGRG